jgi:hypothetical protein
MPGYELHYPPWMIALMAWELLWKGFALWRAKKDAQSNWFKVLLLINSAGVLPIAYLFFFSRTRLFKAPQHS